MAKCLKCGKLISSYLHKIVEHTKKCELKPKKVKKSKRLELMLGDDAERQLREEIIKLLK